MRDVSDVTELRHTAMLPQEARLAVTEEFVLELRRDFHDVVGPTLEKLAAHVSELRKGQGQVRQSYCTR